MSTGQSHNSGDNNQAQLCESSLIEEHILTAKEDQMLDQLADVLFDDWLTSQKSAV